MTPPTMPHRPASPAQQKTTPAMPRIPGVNDKPTPPGFQPKPLIAVILAVVLCAGVVALWLSHRRHADVNPEASAVAAAPEAPVSNASSTSKANRNSDAIATLDELAKPWSSKQFNFTDPKSGAAVAAMVIRLPGPSQSFWAFSLTPPVSRCPLQFVTDLNELSRRFAYPANHPMVISDCDGILYDPLKIATLPNGAWVRGDIVRGGGIRPPLSISVRVHGRELVADRME